MVKIPQTLEYPEDTLRPLSRLKTRKTSEDPLFTVDGITVDLLFYLLFTYYLHLQLL